MNVVRTNQKVNKIEQIRYFSMFTGVGGFELGIENAGGQSNLQRGWNKDSRSPQSLQREGSESSNETTSFSCIGFSEIDKYASELLAKKFPGTKNFGDCTKIKTDELPNFDFLCGGFPCQTFSIAGKRRGFEDTRGTMFFEIARILKAKRPKTILLENVKGLLNHNQGETFKVILQTLDELGYEVQWLVLNSKFFGVPQNRERVFIIGSLRGEPRPEILPFECPGEEINIKVEGYLDSETWRKRHESIRRVYGTDGTSPTIPTGTGGGVMTKIKVPQSQIIKGIEGVSSTINAHGGGQGAKTGLYVMRTPLKFMNRNQKNIEGDYAYTIDSVNTGGIMIRGNVNPSGRGMNGNVYSSQGISPTIDTNKGEGKKIIEDMKIRRLTPTECERLQGFPEGWTEGFSDTQRYKMMGNAVTVNVVAAVISKLFALPKQGETK